MKLPDRGRCCAEFRNLRLVRPLESLCAASKTDYASAPFQVSHLLSTVSYLAINVCCGNELVMTFGLLNTTSSDVNLVNG
jgi:hypothetical protein